MKFALPYNKALSLSINLASPVPNADVKKRKCGADSVYLQEGCGRT